MGVEPSRRLTSLDALRGFDMMWILLPTYPIFHQLLVALGLKGCWLDVQMTHYPWNGFTFYDTIYPLFLFMSGVGFAYSYAKSRETGLSDARVALRLAKRTVVLVLLGSTIYGSLKFDPTSFTLFSVIGRIGISCGLAACIWMCLRRTWMRFAALAAILVIYGFLPFFVSCPGCPAGVPPYAEKDACLYGWVDGNIFPRPLFYAGFSGVFPMIATALAGIFAGDWIRRKTCEPRTCLRGLWGAAGVALAVGLFLAHGLGRFSIPVNKPIWSSSYALVTGAYSLGMLALFYWIIDVRGWRKWSFPFRVVGMNVLFAYMASRTVFPYRWEKEFLFGGVMRLMPTPEWGEFAGQLGYFVVYWLILYALYRKNWFFRA